MSEPDAATAATACYRHPDRRSRIRCQRCERVICTECQNPAPVGVHCPECRASAAQALPRRPSPVARAFRRGSSTPVVTYTIIAITTIMFVLQWVTQGAVTQLFAYYAPLTPDEPWRMLTVALVHSDRSIFHVLINMYSLFVLGTLLERLIGRSRFLAVYTLSILAGSVAVLWLAPLTVVVGASGGIFGLLGAFFVIQRRLGGGSIQLVVLIVINLGLGFVIPGVSWQAHVGGLVVGGLAALVLLRTRRVDQQRRQATLMAGLGLALVVATIARFALL